MQWEAARSEQPMYRRLVIVVVMFALFLRRRTLLLTFALSCSRVSFAGPLLSSHSALVFTQLALDASCDEFF